MKVKLIKFDNFEKAPLRAHFDDSGADIFATEDFVIKPFETVSVPTGFGLELPDGYDAVIHSKSGLSSKGIISSNAPIDAGYRGEVHVILANINGYKYSFAKGEKIGQLVIRPVIYADFVEELGSERNSGAFGSTGK